MIYIIIISQGRNKLRVSCRCGDGMRSELRRLLLWTQHIRGHCPRGGTGVMNVDCAPCRSSVVPALVYYLRFLTAVRKKIHTYIRCPHAFLCALIHTFTLYTYSHIHFQWSVLQMYVQVWVSECYISICLFPLTLSLM